MPNDHINRRSLLTSLLAMALATPTLAQHTEPSATSHSSGVGGAGGHGGGQFGRPVDRQSDDGHGDDHGDDHTSDDHGDDDSDDHASGGKGKRGKGGPQYGGRRDAVASARGGRGRSLEDKVLKKPSF